MGYFSLFFLFCCSLSLFSEEPFERGIDAYIEKSMRFWDVPGVAIAIVKEGRVSYLQGYGVCRVGEARRVDENTLFAIGSCTKAFTAAALALLVDEKKLDWDDPIVRYLPYFELKEPWMTREITVRDILSHVSGLERADLLWYGSSLSREEVFSRLKSLQMEKNFRSEFGYNNLLYLVAGELLLPLTGKSWDEFIQERFFIPLEMTKSSSREEILSKEVNLASPHQKIDGIVTPIHSRSVDNNAPAAAIYSSAKDMSHWVQMLLRKGYYNGVQILSAERIEELFSPQMAVERKDGSLLCYGLGWYVDSYKGNKVVEHAGCVDGMGALVTLLPEKNLGFVILTNRLLTGLPRSIRNHLIDRYLYASDIEWDEKIRLDFVDYEEQAAIREKMADEKRLENIAPSLPLESYVGTFHNDLYGEAHLSIREKRLFIDLLDFHYPLIHWQGNLFYFDPRAAFPLMMNKAIVSFVLNADGCVEGFSLSTYFGPAYIEKKWKKKS